tara:strand:+ start:598 stop:1893 length:1296 start_codon:yes stop_codon:yes gene_type:complete
VYKYFSILVLFIILNQCSLDTKTGIWNKSKIEEEKKEYVKEIFQTEKILTKEFNQNLKIRINSSYSQNPFINNLSNNSGYINFESEFKEVSKFKFKKIKNFEFINPDLLIGQDNSLVFFDDKGSILKFNQNSELIWKVNYYDKKQKKLNPSIYFASKDQYLIAADSIANLYAIDFSNGKLLWKKYNSASFNSELKIYDDKIFLVDVDNNIRCFSLKTGSEIWSFGTQKSFLKSKRKLSLVIQNELVIFIDTFGDISALDINSGSLVWQAQTINEDIFESSFLLKSSRLVYDKETIFISNNQNKFFAINSRNGLIKWEQAINSYLDPVVIKDFIITISEEGYLVVIDKNKGNILRSTSIFDVLKNKKIYPTGFIVAKKFIYVCMSNGRLIKISIEDGKTKNIIKINGETISKPYVLNKKMYILRNNAIIKVE